MEEGTGLRTAATLRADAAARGDASKLTVRRCGTRQARDGQHIRAELPRIATNDERAHVPKKVVGAEVLAAMRLVSELLQIFCEKKIGSV